MKFLRLAIIAAVAMVFLSASAAPAIWAQEPSSPVSSAKGVSVSPSLKELVIGPGLLETKTNLIITNNTGKSLSAIIRLVDFEALGEFGGVSLGQVGAPISTYSLAHWMSLPGGDTVALPNDKPITVPILITNDDELAPGGHYGAAIISVNSENTASGSEVTFKQELASLLFVKKTGGETYGLELKNLNPGKGLPAIPESVTLTFKSTGNVHVVPRGYIEITDPAGKLVAKGIINPESTFVLPDKTRQFVTIMQPVSNADQRGTYKITAYYRYDGQKDFEAQSISFNRGHSVKTIALAIILPLLIVLSGYLIRRRKKAKKRRKIT